MGDNRKANAIYKCVKCGQMYQAVTVATVRKRCNCGGVLHAVPKVNASSPVKP